MPSSGYDRRLSAAARGMRFSAIRRMSAIVERPGIISFAPGQPSPETFPVAAFRDIVEEIIDRDGPRAFQYISTRGVPALLDAIGDYARAKGIGATPSDTIVTEGSQQGLDLLSRVLLDPGDVVFVERPSYVGAISAFRAAQARMVGVRLDEEGLDLEDLRRRHREVAATGEAAKLLYVIPSFQNPSGISHRLERRRAVLEAASELDLLVVEDDPYGDLYFESEPIPTLKSLDSEGRVLYLASFSKILAPGLRTAFLVGPDEILARVEIAKQSANLCGSGLDQRIVLACLLRGVIEEQKATIRPYYRAKRDAMLGALAREMPPGVSWTRPAGGLFLWLTLPGGMDAETLLDAAVAEGVAYVAGAPFFVEEASANTLRLTFAREDAPTIAEGIRRLAKVVKAELTAT